MLLRDSTGRSVEFHLYASSGVDFAEDWLNAGCFNGCNPDLDCKPDADLWVM